MVNTKQISLSYILFLVLVIIFPFGQLTRLEYLGVPIHPIDGLVFMVFLLVLLKLKKTASLMTTTWFLASLLFSYLLSQLTFLGEGIKGFLYLLRLTGYFFFPFFVSNLVKEGRLSKDYIFSLLLLMLAFVGLFGWLQYLFYPDLRFLYYLGWDDHYFRLTGTFLDPGFTSILLVLGLNLSILKHLETKNSNFILLSLFFIISTAFTFSRAGYLALGGSLFLLILLKRKMQLSLLFLTVFGLAVFLLPRPGGEGVNLARTASVGSRLNNYGQTLEIIKTSPLFGVGYNNICEARIKILGDIETKSHGCSGSDSSLMLIVATGGVIGIILFFYFAGVWWTSLEKGLYKEAVLFSSVSLFIHSLFVNSLLYPWVMVVMAALLGLGLVRKGNA